MINNNDLNNIKNYIESKFNIKIQYFENKKFEKNTKIKNITDIFFKIFINILFLIIFIYLFIKINLKLMKYIFLILIIYIILIIINKLLLVINYFKINIKTSSIHNIINYKDIEFKTGDIIQESYNWDYSNGFYGYFLFFYPIRYIRSLN
jgi:ABC-type multidrug transport system fused ATPase/permease subunit